MRIIEIVGDSMFPTLSNGQLVIVYSRSFTPTRNQLVVIQYQDKEMIKRLIGLPNETVELDHTGLQIDGDPIFSPDISLESDHVLPYKWILKNDEILVLGDNPENSLDGRRTGPMKISSLVGCVKLRIWPPKFFRTEKRNR